MIRSLIAASVLLAAVLLLTLTGNTPDRAESKITAEHSRRGPSAINPDIDHPFPRGCNPIDPAALGIRLPKAITDYPAHIRNLIEAREMNAVQTATFHWFREDPSAAHDWIASQPDLTPIENAISQIAHHVASGGDLEAALDWAENIPSADLRNQTYHELLAIALREGRVNITDLDLTGLPEKIIADLNSGAPLD